MADNVTFQAVTPATPPVGTIAATDEVQVNGTQPLAHVQYVKLVDGTPNGTNALAGDSTNGLDVDATRFPPVVTTSGALNAPGQALSIPVNYGYMAIGVQVTGGWTGQLEFEASVDGAAFESHDMIRNLTDDVANATASNGIFFAGVAAFQTFRVRASALSAGAATVTIRLSVGQESVHLESPIPAGSHTIGNVNIAPATTSTRTTVGDDTIDTALLGANAARKQVIIVNESDADLYVALGAAASLIDYTYFLPRQYGGQKSQMELPLPVYTGTIRGIWSSNAGGNARITELT